MTRTMKIYENGKLIEIVKRPETEWIGKPRKSIVRPARVQLYRNGLGSNQYKTRGRARSRLNRRQEMPQWKKTLLGATLILILFSTGMAGAKYLWENKVSPAINKVFAAETVVLISPLPDPTTTPKPSPKPTATPKPEEPSHLVEIVAYITKVFEPEGKAVVVQAINCFYSESGLREEAVGQNTDKYASKDHGVAQLNDHWHNLTEAEKTEYKANIDKAYKIYKGRGNFSAWYGKRCNN